MALSALLAAAAVGLAPARASQYGSCGVVPSPECVNDMGSCGNACCAAEFETPKSTDAVFNDLTSYLKDGGSDGLFSSTGGAGGLRIATPEGSWTSIFQGAHMTFKKHYNDTLNFAVMEKPDGSSLVRLFSISNIAGALGDMGQNRRTVSMMASDLQLGRMKVLYGCGSTPSVPALPKKTPAERNRAVVQSYFDGVFLSNNFRLEQWLEENVAVDGVYQFCPLTAVNDPTNRYPHCTYAEGKQAYSAYVEKDQKEFGDTRIANISYAVSEDGSEVFSRYMVSGTLLGKPVPWFDQVMAWSFGPDGKIKKTVFWSDTLYWHQLYREHSGPARAASLAAGGVPPGMLGYSLFALAVLGSALGIFVAGIQVGRRFEALRGDRATHYLQVA